MKSSTLILTEFYKNLILLAVDDLVSGRIYKGRKPDDVQGECIEINVLNNGAEYIQTGFINLNVYAIANIDNTPDTERFEAISVALVALLADTVFGNYRFQIQNESGYIKDQSQDKLYFINYKFYYQTV